MIELVERFDFDQAAELDFGFNNAVADAVENWGEEAAKAVREIFNTVREIGDLERLTQMSIVLGATACLHPHMESLANETAIMLDDKLHNVDTYGHDDVDNCDNSCKDCLAGKKCKKTK